MILTSYEQSLVTMRSGESEGGPVDEGYEFLLTAYTTKDIKLGPNERVVMPTGMFSITGPKESLLLFPSEQLLVDNGCLVQLLWPIVGELKVLVIHVGDKPPEVVIEPGQVLGTLVSVQMP
jgi:hypothetical protein